MASRLLANLFAVSLICNTISIEGEGVLYQKNDDVIVYVNKVGPYNNPHETYHYFKLPVCAPIVVEYKSMSLGEVIDGDLLAKSLYRIKFLQPLNKEMLCHMFWTEKDYEKLRTAVEEDYYYEWMIDEIPVRGFIGYLEEQGFLPHHHRVYIHLHYTFIFEYTSDVYGEGKIISVNVTNDEAPKNINEMEDAGHVTWTYSVKWVKTDSSTRVKGNVFFPKTLEIRWLSIINSCFLVVLLLVFLGALLAALIRRDFKQGDVEMELEDSGWKVIHTDVFRIPKFRTLLAAIIGTGSQFIVIFSIVIGMLIFGGVGHHHSVMTAAITIYLSTSALAGFVAARWYKRLGGERWVWTLNVTSILFIGPFFLTWCVENTISWAYKSTQALPASTVIALMALWIFLGYPSTIIGGIFGRQFESAKDFPCRARQIPREIPTPPPTRSNISLCIFGGLLPFTSILVELYYIWATIWGREQYYLWGVLGLTLLILAVVTASATATLIYIQLATEDYRWWWNSIFYGGSCAIYLFIYSVYYYVAISDMDGMQQVSRYFGYTLISCYLTFLTLGTVGFLAANRLTFFMYSNLKMD